jgi:hypothetical protein
MKQPKAITKNAHGQEPPTPLYEKKQNENQLAMVLIFFILLALIVFVSQ